MKIKENRINLGAYPLQNERPENQNKWLPDFVNNLWFSLSFCSESNWEA
jgi:hypothetical protein